MMQQQPTQQQQPMQPQQPTQQQQHDAAHDMYDMPVAIAMPVPIASAEPVEATPTGDEAESLPVAVALPIATPVVRGSEQSSPLASAPPEAPSHPGAPSRVRALFCTLDSDEDGRVTYDEYRRGFESEFGPELPPHAHDAITTLFEANAIGDLSFAGRYVDRRLFNGLYAEILFRTHDVDNDGYLTHEQMQAALKHLAGEVAFACPMGECDPTTGEMRIPAKWFGGLYRNMP